MKINDKKKISFDNYPSTGEKNEKLSKAEFKNTLHEIKAKDTYNNMMNMVEEISRQGERLAKKMDITELRYYKKMVSDFLKFSVSDSFSFEKETLCDRSGVVSVYSSIEKVNTKLEHLTKEILSEEKDNIEILKLLDDIRGLILDVFV